MRQVGGSLGIAIMGALLATTVTVAPLDPLVASSDALGQTCGLAERDEVAARQLFYVEAKPGARDGALKLEREQPVVAAREDAGRNLGPGRQRPGLSEDSGSLDCRVG